MASKPESRHLHYLPSSYAAQDFFKNFLSFADRIRTLEHWSDEVYGKEVFPAKSKARLKKKQLPGGISLKGASQRKGLTSELGCAQTSKANTLEGAKGPDVGKQRRKKVKKNVRDANSALEIRTDNVETKEGDIAQDAVGCANQRDRDGLEDAGTDGTSNAGTEWADLPKPTPEHTSSGQHQWDSEDESAEGQGAKIRKEWADLPKPTPENTCKKPRPKHRPPKIRPMSAAAWLPSISPEKESSRMETPTRTQRSQSAAAFSLEDESQQNPTIDESRPETPSSKMLRLKPQLVRNEQTSKEALHSLSREQLMAAHKIFVGCPECFGSLGGKCVKHLSTSWQGSELLQSNSQGSHPPGSRPGDLLKVKVMTASDTRKRGIELHILFRPTDTVRCLKERVAEQEGTPVDFQRLLVAGKYYDNDKATREECGFGDLEDKTAFIVLQPQTSKLTVGAACDWCFRAVGGVCTHHLKPVSGKDRRGMDSDLPQRPSTAQAHPSTPNSSRMILRSQSSDASFELHERNDEYYLGSGPRFRRSTGDIFSSGVQQPTPLSNESTPVSIPSVQSSVISGRTSLSSTSPSFRYSASRIPPIARAGTQFSISQLSAVSSNYPLRITKKLANGGCPMCATAVNGKCHRCLPVYKDGVQQSAHEDLDQQYKDALKAAALAREAVLKGGTPVWFTHDGEPCRSGTVVSVLFEDGEWRQGKVDAFHAKAERVRIKFDDTRIAPIHAALSEIQMRVLNGEILREEDEDEILDLDEDEDEEDELEEDELEMESEYAAREARVKLEGPALRVDVGVGTDKEGGAADREVFRHPSQQTEDGGRRAVVRIPHQQMEEESPEDLNLDVEERVESDERSADE